MKLSKRDFMICPEVCYSVNDGSSQTETVCVTIEKQIADMVRSGTLLKAQRSGLFDDFDGSEDEKDLEILAFMRSKDYDFVDAFKFAENVRERVLEKTKDYYEEILDGLGREKEPKSELVKEDVDGTKLE